MTFLICITAFCFLCAFWNLLIAILGLFPQYRATAIGTLKKANTRRNVQGKHRIIPVVTDYTYFYTVNHKRYKYTGGNYQRRQRLFPKITLEYVKWFPRHVYEKKFTGAEEWVVGICMLILGILCFWVIQNI